MKKIFFVTGTDTDCGKTYCTLKLMHQYKKINLSVLGLKPIASGCTMTDEGLRNDDALKLQQTSSIKLNYDLINPFAFEPAIAPHIAANLTGTKLTASEVCQALEPALNTNCDVIFIEGAGGLQVPLNTKETWIDVIKLLNIPVIFIVGLKLGCINHALLSLEKLRNSNIEVADIIYNPIDPSMLYQRENIDMIDSYIRSRVLIFND